MPLISDETANLLTELGVLNENMEITPEAYVGAISRKPVDEQARMLGLPVIIRPFTKKGGSPEKQFIKYFQSRVKENIDGGESWSTEGYLIKSLLSFIIPEFDYRSRTHNYSNKEIAEQVFRITELNSIDIVEKCELFLGESRDGVALDFSSEHSKDVEINKTFLRNRFKNSRPYIASGQIFDESDEERFSKAKIKERENNYINFLLGYLELWHSLSRDEWKDLAETTLQNWRKMFSGWPDLIFFSKENGLTLIEIKGSDKIHASQVYTLLKLKEVLGSNRIAIGWLNSGKINFSGKYYSAHMKEAIEWLNTKWYNREPLKCEIRKL